MTKPDIKMLRHPNVPRPAYTLCEALVQAQGWTEYWHQKKKEEAKRLGREPYKCTHVAYCTIDGVPYCSIHCGPVLISKLGELE